MVEAMGENDWGVCRVNGAWYPQSAQIVVQMQQIQYVQLRRYKLKQIYYEKFKKN